MVDVTHDGDHRRARLGLALELEGFGQLFFQCVLADQRDLVAQLFGNQLRGFLVEHLVDGHRGAHLEHELDHLGAFHRHLRGQFGHGDGLADVHFANDRTARALEAVLVALLQLALAATAATTEAIALFLGAARSNTRRRRLFLQRRTRLGLLALATLVILVALGRRTTGFVTGTLGGTRLTRFHSHRSGDGSSPLGSTGLTGSHGADPCLFGIGATAWCCSLGPGFGLGFRRRTRRHFGRALLVLLALLLGGDFGRLLLDESLLLAYFDADGLAASNPQGAGGLALQGDLAGFFQLLTVAALQMRQ
ncbi:hypothetical protein D3C75_801610 [compost metagenome]